MNIVDMISDALVLAKAENKFHSEAVRLLQLVILEVDGDGGVSAKTIKAISLLLDSSYKFALAKEQSDTPRATEDQP